MRISGFLLLAIPFVSATALSVTSRDTQTSVNPPISVQDLRSPLDVTVADVSTVPETNAQRLARGLSPLSPKSVHHGHSASRRTPTRAHAVRAGPSATPVAGVLQVFRSDGSSMGYVRKDFNVFGEYGITDKVDEALPVSASAPADGSTFNLLNQNTDQLSVYPTVGLTNGFASTSDDMSTSSFNYAYLSGTQPSKSGSPLPANSGQPNSFSAATGIDKATESMVWTYDAATQNIKATWYNTDHTPVSTQLVYYGSDDVIIATASADTFRNSFGSAGNPDITLKLVMIGA